MPIRDRLVQAANRPHLPRRTVRLRLTAIYATLFLASGAVLLAITYVLVRNATSGAYFAKTPGGGAAVFGPPNTSPSSHQVLHDSGLTTRQLQAQSAQLHAQSVQQHATEMHQLLLNSGIALAAMLLISIALGWVVAGRVLRPLRTITATARDISATNLDQRLALAGPDDELKELGDTFDGLLERLDAAFSAQRQFVANASHELRTPLARQRTVGQVALRDPHATTDTLRTVIERILDTGRQQERLIDALLTLARGHAGLDHRQPIDLSTVVDTVLLAPHPDADRLGIHVDSTIASAPLDGDPRLLEALVANLVDNAIKHNTPGGHVHVTTGLSDGHAVLNVTNSGPDVPAADIQRLLQPFQRLGPQRTGIGLGLGLSIVEAIATAHHATLTLHPNPGGGLHVTVSFPARSSDPARQTRKETPACRPNPSGVPPERVGSR